MESEKRNIAAEVLQDMFTLHLCFETQSKIKNIFLQELYGYIEVYFYSVFLYEFCKAGLGKVLFDNKELAEVKQFLEELRMCFLKKQVRVDGKHTKTLMEGMGIDFDHFMYDLILTVEESDNDKLYSINFGLWDLACMDKRKVVTFNSLAQLPEKIIEDALHDMKDQELAEEVIGKIDSLCEGKANKVEKIINPIKYPYASGVLFCDSKLCEQDKILILYYYSYFTLFGFVDELIPALEVEKEGCGINTKHSLMKLKAMLIGQFGDNIKDLNTTLVEKIKIEISQTIHEKDAFKINRKLRDNIHYGRIDAISDEEWEVIEVFQKKYFDIVLKEFNVCIHYKFGKVYKFIKWIADHTDSNIRKQKKLEKQNNREEVCDI